MGPLKILGGALGGFVLLALLIIGGVSLVIHRADSTLRQLLSDYAIQTVRTESDSVYRLTVGHIGFNWALRHVAVDSAIVTTDSVVNARREHPLPAIRVGLYGCTLSGVSLRKIVLRRGLDARRFGCGVVTVDVAIPRDAAKDTSEITTAARDRAVQPITPFLVLQQGLKLPNSVPTLRIKRIDFPHASFVLTRPRARGDLTRFALEHLEWHVQDMIIDPDVPLAASRPLFAKSVALEADQFEFRPDSVTRVGVGFLRINVTDSLLRVGGVSFAPTVSDARFARERPWRRSRVKLAASAITMTGFDFGKLMRRGGLYMRRLDVDSMVADVWSDKRLPPNPHPPTHLTPQAWLAEGPGGYGVDSVTVNGSVTYREVRDGHERSGVLRFGNLTAVATNVHHVVGRRSYDDPMTLNASATFMGAARLDVRFVVPLDAPHFTMSFTGRLGAMPATALNDLLEHTQPARITDGDIDHIAFHAEVRGGRALGEVIPVYRDLRISVTGRGAAGLLGSPGTLAKIARGIATFVANQTRIRYDNPERPDRPPVTGRIDHAFVPRETLPAFLWAGLREGLFSVVKK